MYHDCLTDFAVNGCNFIHEHSVHVLQVTQDKELSCIVTYRERNASAMLALVSYIIHELHDVSD